MKPGGVSLLVLACGWSAVERLAAPLSLPAENARCFQIRGKPPVLVTSGEHYGAVLFIRQADRRGVAVELVLFCSMYDGKVWEASPMHVRNYINGVARQNTYPVLLRDCERVPAKPCGLGEGTCEDGPQYRTKPINALVIRKQACGSWFAGGCHTCGNGNVWHFGSCKPELTHFLTAFHIYDADRGNGMPRLAHPLLT